MAAPAKPKGFENELGPYGPQVYDSYSGKPIGWGFRIITYLGEYKFQQLSRIAYTHCLGLQNWVVLTRHLDLKDAIKKFGYPTKITTGPRGGFRTIYLGKTHFSISHFNWNFEIRDDYSHFPDVLKVIE